jgi:capsular polysaccharide export protein
LTFIGWWLKRKGMTMPTNAFHFICLDPRKSKKAAINSTLQNLGSITWRRLPPIRLKEYPETSIRAKTAFDSATKKPTGSAMMAVKIALLRAQYNGARSFFEENRDAIAVSWNGLNGTRRAFMDGARDAGARTLYFELSPFAGRITVDPCGVNNANSLPREIGPYLAWAKNSGMADSWREVIDTIQARKPFVNCTDATTGPALTEPFIFVPLQVPGDSQLRLFGGNFRTVEAMIEATIDAARNLPDGWHLRLKEHPSSHVQFGDLIAKLAHPKIVLDNLTDTFAQVAAARAVITVNSSVGLEAMFFEKPVVALGECFWAIPGVATHCPTVEGLVRLLKDPEALLSFDPGARSAFLSFLTQVYYPKLPHDGKDMVIDEVNKVRARLVGPDTLGFWQC